ncbi:MAG: hypothetical protein PHD82_14975, partial [Candidatus Riflebacteria bacterium]|nr:hypothetical protein [Candidatus Riflebacteria bacterium]
MADKINKKQRLSELAAALATLTAHKLQFSAQTMSGSTSKLALPDDDSSLKPVFNYLAQPLSSFSTSKEFDLPLSEDSTPHFALLVEGLWQAAGFADELVEETKVVVNRSDFTATGPSNGSYNREKNGHVKICVNLKLQNNGKIHNSLDFDYSCPVRISTIHAPVLSKFNLFIEDAHMAAGNREVGYNQVSVDQFGNLAETRTRAIPLVLNNDDNLNLRVKTEFRDFVNDSRGLVYLGGNSRLLLNLARSDVLAPNANSGEAFQFFRSEGFDGFYPVHDGNSPVNGRVLVSIMDQGVSDDTDNRNASFYSRILSGHHGIKDIAEGRMQLASIFRLFGTQARPSPTLVLGQVCSRFLSIARMTGAGGKKVNPPIIDNTSYAPPAGPPPYFITSINEPENEDLRLAFGLNSSPGSFIDFLFNYGSRIRERPYNQGLAYINHQENPDALRDFPESDKLSKFLKSSNHEGTHAIPDSFAGIFPEVTDLKSLSALLTPSTGLARVSYKFDNPGNENALALLAGANLVSNGRLALNGWVRFKSGIKIDRDLEYLSSAGIIVESGDITISGSLLPANSRENCLVYLVALDGNIIFDCNPGKTLQAAVVADSDRPDQGRVIFRRPPAA